MRADKIFLIASEAKDKYCLDPIVEGLKAKFNYVVHLNFFEDITKNDGALLREFARSNFPVVIVSSAIMVRFLALIRPRESFLCIGIEHGIAPFKSYTYGRHLLSSDFYLAPTKGWADRLARLYPEARSQVRVGGYPKIEAIKERAGLTGAASGPGRKRILVILSWGVSEDAFQFLPDQDFIDYVLHPADYKLQQSVTLSKARLHVSSPDVTYDLISSASLVVGDFSSLTLECIHLGKHVIFMVDRTIYKGNCDLEADFFNKGGPAFGIIPASSCKIAVDDAITAKVFAELVDTSSDYIDRIKSKTKQAKFDSTFLPPAAVDNREFCVDEIANLLEFTDTWRGSFVHAQDASIAALESMCFIFSSYKAILGRFPDEAGLRHYLKRLEILDSNTLRCGISLWHELSNSREAKEKIFEEEAVLPRIFFPTSDPLKRAQTYAAQDRLLEALYWVSKAIDRDPENGEYMRFRASILERMGLIEQALNVAREAQRLGADADAIAVDIDRLNARQIANLEDVAERILPGFHRQQRDQACCNADRIRYGAKVAVGPDVDVVELVGLAHACASEEQLADALYWIGKAIEIQPREGEHLRFKASLLERMERLADAADVAVEAENNGADPVYIAADIDRINSKLVAKLRMGVNSEDNATALSSYSQLLALGALSRRDVVKFAWKIFKAFV